MTCREKLFKEYPNLHDHSTFFDWNMGCPHHYGYAPKPINCSLQSCSECWDRKFIGLAKNEPEDRTEEEHWGV